MVPVWCSHDRLMRETAAFMHSSTAENGTLVSFGVSMGAITVMCFLVNLALCLSVQHMPRTEAEVGGQLVILGWTQRGGK